VSAAQVLRVLARLGLAAMFLYAGVLKLLEPAGLAQDISNYRLLPAGPVPALAVGLPVLEIVTGLALLTRNYARGGAALSALMLALFAAAMAQAELRGIDVACGCFGADSTAQVSFAKVAQNVALAILSIWIAWSFKPPLPQTTPAAPPPSAQPS
jgi:putative oxidoreductase